MSGLDDAISWICLKCGEPWLPASTSTTGLCPSCEHKDIMVKVEVKYQLMRKSGWIPESRRKAGRKAYETRIARLSWRDPKSYDRIMKKLTDVDPRRAARIRRKARKEQKQIA